MAYDEYLAERIDQILISRKVEFLVKKMMGGLCYMMDDKILCGIIKDQLMARIGLKGYEEALKVEGVNIMNFTGRSMKGYIFIEMDAIDTDVQLEYWIERCLTFNPLAKSSKKGKKS
jgi:TfoX/Sxy family transcriptional regulator of competence genes